MDIRVFPDSPALVSCAAGIFASLGWESINQRGRYAVGLSGGSTPLPLYQHLARSRSEYPLDWSKVHFFWGDERPVGPDHPDSNYGQADRILLSPLDIPRQNIHPIRGDLAPAAAAKTYQQEISAWFGQDSPSLDLILLGMGSDGHTLSLFPGSALLDSNTHDEESWVNAVYVPRLESWRITLTPRLIRAARQVVYLVTGAAKAPILQQVLSGPYQPDRYPAQLFREDAIWLIDGDAAGMLEA